MAERKIPVAAVQTLAHDALQFEECWPRIASAVESAASLGVALVVVPEGTVPGYVIGTDPLDAALLERAVAHIGRIARAHRTTIVYGAAHRDGTRTFNTGTVVGPDGTVVGRAEKQFLWHFDGRWFARGRALQPIATPAGMLGVLICADGRIPTLARTLVERGAELLVMPTAWVTSGRDPNVLENVQADYMAAVRARENGVPLICANKVGVEAGAVAYCGKSAIFASDGRVLARAAERVEEILVADVTVGSPLPESCSPVAYSAAYLGERTRARIGITPSCDPAELARLARVAAFSDVDVLVTAERGAVEGDRPPRLACGASDDAVRIEAGLAVARVSNSAVLDPGALVPARLHGVDMFVWNVVPALDPQWQISFARTRAAELRAYVIVIDSSQPRAFAVDPDGTIVCGTFDGFRLAQFAYDRARSAATAVAPNSDVLAGLRAVESLRHGEADVRA